MIPRIAVFLFLMPICSFTQTLKLNLGPSFSNASGELVVGLSTTVGVDYFETKWTFLSANLGLVQRGISKNSYTTANIQGNIKLSQGKFIPFFSIGPRVDYFLDAPEIWDHSRYVIGANGGVGLMKRMEKLELGVRADYHYNFTKPPNDPAVIAMLFVGFRI